MAQNIKTATATNVLLKVLVLEVNILLMLVPANNVSSPVHPQLLHILSQITVKILVLIHILLMQERKSVFKFVKLIIHLLMWIPREHVLQIVIKLAPHLFRILQQGNALINVQVPHLAIILPIILAMMVNACLIAHLENIETQ